MMLIKHNLEITINENGLAERLIDKINLLRTFALQRRKGGRKGERSDVDDEHGYSLRPQYHESRVEHPFSPFYINTSDVDQKQDRSKKMEGRDEGGGKSGGV